MKRDNLKQLTLQFKPVALKPLTEVLRTQVIQSLSKSSLSYCSLSQRVSRKMHSNTFLCHLSVSQDAHRVLSIVCFLFFFFNEQPF